MVYNGLGYMKYSDTPITAYIVACAGTLPVYSYSSYGSGTPTMVSAYFQSISQSVGYGVVSGANSTNNGGLSGNSCIVRPPYTRVLSSANMQIQQYINVTGGYQSYSGNWIIKFDEYGILFGYVATSLGGISTQMNVYGSYEIINRNFTVYVIY